MTAACHNGGFGDGFVPFHQYFIGHSCLPFYCDYAIGAHGGAVGAANAGFGVGLFHGMMTFCVDLVFGNCKKFFFAGGNA
jgi:hypothetical protein